MGMLDNVPWDSATCRIFPTESTPRALAVLNMLFFQKEGTMYGYLCRHLERPH